MTKKIKPFQKAGGYTTFENEILDHIMPKCTPNEWKIVCATIRLTIGWQKEYDWITIERYKQLTGIKGTGTCHAAVIKALNHRYIKRKPRGRSFIYSLNKDFELVIPEKIYIPEIGIQIPEIGTPDVPKTRSTKQRVKRKSNKRNSTPLKNRKKYTEGDYKDFIN